MVAASSSSIISCLLSRDDSVLWISSGWRWLRFNTCSDQNGEVSQVIGRWEFQWPAQTVEREVPSCFELFQRWPPFPTHCIWNGDVYLRYSASSCWASMAAPKLSSSCWQFKYCLHFMTHFLAISFEQIPEKWCFSDKYPSPSMIYLSRLEYRKGCFKQQTPKTYSRWPREFFLISQDFPSIMSQYICNHTTSHTHWGTEKCIQHIHTGRESVFTPLKMASCIKYNIYICLQLSEFRSKFDALHSY